MFGFAIDFLRESFLYLEADLDVLLGGIGGVFNFVRSDA